ncbi:MAG: sugar ABC transporter ATP-binding protein [Bacillota bacterium]|nr:sugar ABC transporter ATP-binding protein [Bacillota bacterium]
MSYVEMRGIYKSFPGVSALRGVNLEIRKGEILAIVGENGAGKTTLMRILCGADTPDKGEIAVDGKLVNVRSPRQAQELGIFMVQQELSLVPSMSVMENIVLGREARVGPGGILDARRNSQQAIAALELLGLDIDLQTRVRGLDVATQQMVEIARNLARSPKVLIMDEPTAALSAPEIEKLFLVLKNLRRSGVSVVFISHKLEEILRLSDRVMVLRDGQTVGTLQTEQTTRQDLISMMVGRSITEQVRTPSRLGRGADALRVEGISRKGKFRDISFAVQDGEVLGLFGLKGSGRTEVARAIFGADSIDTGRVLVRGQEVRLHSPVDAANRGLGFLTEDRKSQGLFLNLSVKDNITIANLSCVCSQAGIINERREAGVAHEYIRRLGIKAPSIFQRVKYLSGGNQQKVLLARWVFRGSHVLILDEPTKGIDVGAKREVYLLIDELARRGLAVIVISSEIEEILAVSDTIVVMRAGTVSAVLPRDQAETEVIMHYAAG